ncbi:hypothetical protein [Halapricum hydrolyticum]|uniref:Uncharacterized protein n=1 Tax=Halapricum hydrolyticum TaxID=2979991 RepID=A0AAE3IBB8_9EURY|nr:hypothetical protein [Halapricum hydrolyticum]MCU4717126.1 hypothetical protein [Halapricum hydrolyticum]MCU4726053.1 hypothetical protein [Halapricum hydrolyticum]
MTRLRRYLGERHRLLVWTVLIAGGGWVAITEFENELAAYADRPAAIAAFAGVWLAGVLVVRRRERRAWRRLIDETPFEPQHEDDRRPPLQRSLKGNVITAEPVGRGLVRQQGIRVEATAGGVTAPIDVTLTYVGSGGTERGIRTGTDALDEQFVFEVTAGSNLASVFDAEVQSALLDVSIPGRLRIDGRHVSYEIPFTRVRPSELGTVSKAVATIAARMEHLVATGRL